MSGELSRRTTTFEYDVCLSFAGEDRKYVREVAAQLRGAGARVFYDEYEKVGLWGKDLFQHLDHIYTSSARFCVVFISKHYAQKLWTNHEIKSAQARAFSINSEFILPARFDETEIPGIRTTTGYIDLRSTVPSECASMIVQKLSPYKLLEFHNRGRYFPPNPDILYRSLKARSNKAKRHAYIAGHGFFRSLDRLSEEERRAVIAVFVYSCGHDFPNNVHIEIDLVRRIIGTSRAEILNHLSEISSVGFEVRLCDGDGVDSDDPKYIYIKWVCRSGDLLVEESNYSMAVALCIVELVTRHYCHDHAVDALMGLNFSSLSRATAIDDVHD